MFWHDRYRERVVSTTTGRGDTRQARDGPTKTKMVSNRYLGRSARKGGFTLVDLMVAATLLVLGLGSLSGTVVAALEVARANEERSRASDAARAMAERLQGTTFRQVFATYNRDATDDPEGEGTAPGHGFAINGLRPFNGDDDGLPGRIDFPVLADTGPGVLREDADDPALGLPRDLNGDSDVDALDHTDDYILLPVTITVEWRGVSGERFHTLRLLLVRS